MKKDKPEHFSFTPYKFTGDSDFQVMTDAERGCFVTIIFYLYQNAAICNLDLAGLKHLCNSKDFENIWKKIEKKFSKTKRGFTHKKVAEEYKAAKKRMQTARNKGVKGMASRYSGNSTANSSAITKLSKVKISNNNIYTHTPATGKFTLTECKDAAVLVGLTPEQAEVFFNHYNSQGWLKGNNLPITNLPSQLSNWKQNNYKFEGKNNGQVSGSFSKHSEKAGGKSTADRNYAEQQSKFGTTIQV
ncbi:MAG: hypothetical protein WC356_03690 [Candidatus Micrarchaeia archaeon]|jgi:hypothetical protein